MKKILRNKYVLYSLFAFGGLLLGWLFFHSSHKVESNTTITVQQGKATIWTCAMHPQIRMDKPGKCPICGMDLIPLVQNNTPVDENAIHLSKEAVELANVLTSIVTKQKPVKEVRLYGKVQADERLLQSQVAHISGRIEKLMVNFTGEGVRNGQTLALIYSPDLVTAQQELLEAVKSKQTQPEIYNAAKEKLSQWKLTDAQIAKIEGSGIVQTNFEVVSNTTGIITARRINNGDYITQGTVLFDVADLSNVWIMFDAYESDLPYLNEDDNISFSVQALPGTGFSGKIIFIDPVLDPVTRVSKVRVEISNASATLKPEMFATGIVNANLTKYKDKLVIPKSAVLWTGKRSIVYVKQPNNDESNFSIREIELGPMLGNSYVILGGLTEGEEIVTQGTFSVDAAAQLEGKPSMMNQKGGKVNTMPGMDMPGIDMSGKAKSDNKEKQNTGDGHDLKNEVSMDFTMQLNDVFDNYIVLKEALVTSDINKATQAAQKVQQALSKVDVKILENGAQIKWSALSGKLNNQIKLIASSGKLEDQRLAFAPFSQDFYETIKAFGLMGKTVYYQSCPMANNKKRAYWLSEVKEIRNPYLGEKMLTCGETTEILKH